jgi:hypothetical protein
MLDPLIDHAARVGVPRDLLDPAGVPPGSQAALGALAVRSCLHAGVQIRKK